MIAYKSINCQNSSLETREAYFHSLDHEDERPHVLLQTCNRLEVYYGEGDVPADVARHLFRVTAGLESALVGERAVQGQVKEAYLNARTNSLLPSNLHKLFEYALMTGKRVRNETEISQGAVSHSLAAIEIIKDAHVDLRQARITIIGVNKLTDDILKFLKNKGAKTIFLANRSEEKARAMAAPYGFEVFSLKDKREFLAKTDILISATSAPHAIVKKEDCQDCHSLLAIDLAFPRDIDEEVGLLPGVSLFNLQDVERRVQKNISVRQNEVAKAESIIDEEVTELLTTLARRQQHAKA